MNQRYENIKQHLMEAVLKSPGASDKNLRLAVEARSAALSGKLTQGTAEVPTELAAYVDKVALYAYKTTDDDIQALIAAGYSEDAIFEITLSAALGAGMARLERGRAALGGNG